VYLSSQQWHEIENRRTAVQACLGKNNQNNQSKKGWRRGLSDRAPAWGVHTLSSNPKEKKKNVEIQQLLYDRAKF
jgi:hypothetical protein